MFNTNNKEEKKREKILINIKSRTVKQILFSYFSNNYFTNCYLKTL